MRKLGKLLSVACAFVFLLSAVACDVPSGAENVASGLRFEKIQNEEAYRVIGTVNNQKEFIIPETFNDLPVTEIGERAFYDNDVITYVALSNNVTKIGKNAFKDCGFLNEIFIPTSLEKIDEGAFEKCNLLKHVLYDGVFEEIQHDPLFPIRGYSCKLFLKFEVVEIADGNGDFLAATLYEFSESEPTVRPAFWHYVDGKPTRWTTMYHEWELNHTQTPTCNGIPSGDEGIPDYGIFGCDIYYCPLCGWYDTRNVVDALHHVWGEEVFVVEPTATEWGHSYRVCEVCGDEIWFDYTDPTGQTE